MILDLLFRLVHILAAIVLLGGTIYIRTVLIPSASELPEPEHDALRVRTRERWKKIVMLGILLLLVSGFWNYLMVNGPAHQGANRGQYHMLMGIKILLALGVFFLASVLTGRAAKFDAMRRSPAKWLSILIGLALAVVTIGSVLKVAVPASGAVPATARPAPPHAG
ncbi:MAG: hypothetical protein ACK5Q5_18385 [Planctomycetaceae bacterium]